MSRERGFSLVELMTVCVVLIIISAIAVPNIARINASYKLDASGHSVASLLQQARMQAVKTNQPAYAKYDNATGMVYITSDPGLAYVAGNPDVAVSKGLTFNAAPPSFHGQLDAYVGAGVWQIPDNIGFNARGLPCIAVPGNPALCVSFPPKGFEWFIQNGSGGWVAVTVTPAGRIKTWRLNSTSAGTWQ
ncbi:MAG TPA: prepilin-type N-terminal cleavage/methylation domain-containing protein [Candidatus Sulfotelmatobacter sp.]|nr:prepilin-type N-terminal cleavage/methylation domain-containing protein [Candidatus Sulfotelmatobacter sp.]